MRRQTQDQPGHRQTRLTEVHRAVTSRDTCHGHGSQPYLNFRRSPLPSVVPHPLSPEKLRTLQADEPFSSRPPTGTKQRPGTPRGASLPVRSGRRRRPTPPTRRSGGSGRPRHRTTPSSTNLAGGLSNTPAAFPDSRRHHGVTLDMRVVSRPLKTQRIRCFCDFRITQSRHCHVGWQKLF